jgi:hypothetical protein
LIYFLTFLYSLGTLFFTLVFMKKFVLPLALLASISALTSCSSKTTTPTPETPATPQVTVETVPPVVPASPEVTTPPVVPPVENTQSAMPVTRTETVSYKTPAGEDPVEFSVSVLDGTITAVTATPKATNDISAKRQAAFAGEISSKVVGKKISELNLSAVGGSSLTTDAFTSFIKTF